MHTNKFWGTWEGFCFESRRPSHSRIPGNADAEARKEFRKRVRPELARQSRGDMGKAMM